MASSRLQILFLGTLSACTTYTPSDVSVATVIAATTDHPGGALSLDQANLLALQRNPEILAALAEQRAAAAVVQPLMLAAEYRSGTEMLALMLDPVALLGSGPRGGAQGVDAAKATAALVAVREAVWRVHGELLETFAVDRALAELDVPGCEVDGAAFAAAGLATAKDVQSLTASRAALAAERQALASDRLANQARLRRLLGLGAEVDVVCVHGEWDLPDPSLFDAQLLRGRPDVSLAAAQFVVADAEFRAAVRAQWPTLMIGPELPLMGGGVDVMATLTMPLLQHGLAAAAGEQREAAHQRLRATWLDVVEELTATRAEREALQAAASAAAERAAASGAALQAALVAVEVEGDAFAMLAEAAAMAADDTRMARELCVAAARATSRAAQAAGWPKLEVVR